MGLKKILFKTILILIAINFFVIFVNSHQIYKNVLESLSKLKEQYFEATYEIYKDQITGDLLVNNVSVDNALLEEIVNRRDVGVRLKYKNLTLKEGDFDEREASKNYNIDLGNGENATFSLYPLKGSNTPQIDEEIWWLLALEIFVLGLGFIYIGRMFSEKILIPLKSLVENLKPEKIENYIPPEKTIPELIELTKTLKELNVEVKEKAFLDIALQVAHDIRSPMTALNVILKNLLPQLPEKERIILRNAANRINDTANNLLTQYKNKDYSKNTINAQDKLQILLMEPILETMISEKRLSCEDRSVSLNINISQKAYFVFAKVNVQEIKRVLSNLINNALESFEVGTDGVVFIRLFVREDEVYIQVEDNGCGISPDKVPEIFQIKITTKAQGSGIGLTHAKKEIEKMYGTIDIQSKVGEGTTVTIILPIAIPPRWFISKILICHDELIAILDDDESIHGAWDTKLNPVSPKQKIFHFNKGDDFINWYLKNKNQRILVLSDYELLNESQTGLDILEKLNVINGILVSSHYEESDIIERCLNAGIYLLPKNLVTHVPIEFKDTMNDSMKVISPSISALDLVLIDDEMTLRELLEMSAKSFGKNIRTFESPVEFEHVCDFLDRETPIYIDSDLGNGIKGELYAKKLFDRGFINLYLTTGYESASFKEMYWFKMVVEKEFLFDLISQ